MYTAMVVWYDDVVRTSIEEARVSDSIAQRDALVYNFLSDIGDYAVGGDVVTPVLMQDGNWTGKRVGLKTLEEWTLKEFVHLCPGPSVERSVMEGLGLEYDDDTPRWRTFVLDFDVYGKDGEAKGPAFTADEVIESMREAGVPLPYACVPSGTPGNFHLVFVFRDAQTAVPGSRRNACVNMWGSDPGFTYGLSRNPVYYSYHPASGGRRTRWWIEWSAEAPYIDSVDDLIPDGQTPSTKLKKSHVSYSGDRGGTWDRWRPHMTLLQLTENIKGAKDGDGRWKMLRSMLTRTIYAYTRDTGEYLTRTQRFEVLQAYNALLEEELPYSGLVNLADYYNKKQMRKLVHRMSKAGQCRSNVRAKTASVIRYFKLAHMREQVTAMCLGKIPWLTSEMEERFHSFERYKPLNQGRATARFLAHVLDSDYKLVRMHLNNGKSRGYTLAEYKAAIAQYPQYDIQLTNLSQLANMEEEMKEQDERSADERTEHEQHGTRAQYLCLPGRPPAHTAARRSSPLATSGDRKYYRRM